jgi:riboflavin biosynthesis pyrimidine reductase
MPDEPIGWPRITTLHEREGADERRPRLPAELARLYDGDLSFPKTQPPYVIGNFVQTMDGIVSYRIPGRSGGGEISGSSAEDRFVMGLLRSVADAVLFGSGTLHGDSGHVRTAEFVYPEAAHLYASLREQTGRPRLPLNVVLTASGRIDLNEPTFHTDGLTVVVITTDAGAARLALDHEQALSDIVVRSTGAEAAPSPGAVLKILAGEFGVRVLLHEGGPTIFGEFLRAGAIDELFLTLAPQVAGRDGERPRPGLAATSFLPETAPWFSLRSIKRSPDDLLLLRYVAVARTA